MASSRNVSIRFTEDEYADLLADAEQVAMDVTPFVKHVALKRGKVKLKANAADAAVITRLEAQNAEMQKQIDGFHAEKTSRETLTGLGALPSARSIDEIVADKVQRMDDARKLAEFEELKKQHADQSKQLAEAERASKLMGWLERSTPVLAHGLGSALVNGFPDAARGLIPMVQGLGGLAGLPAGDDADGAPLSDVEEQYLGFARTVFDALPPDQAPHLVELVEAIAAQPALLPYLQNAVRAARRPAPPAPTPTPVARGAAPPPAPVAAYAATATDEDTYSAIP